MLDCPGADAAVGLPEADSMVVSSSGQNDRVAAHRPLVHIHACLRVVTAQGEACTTLKYRRESAAVVFSLLLHFKSTLSREIVITVMLWK